MASIIARRAFTTSARRFSADKAGEQVLKQESKRNPELYVRHILRRPPLLASLVPNLHLEVSETDGYWNFRSSEASWSPLWEVPVSTSVSFPVPN